LRIKDLRFLSHTHDVASLVRSCYLHLSVNNPTGDDATRRWAVGLQRLAVDAVGISEAETAGRRCLVFKQSE